MMRWTFPLAATIAAMLLVSQAANAGTVFPKVLVSVPTLKPYVDEILRGHGSSTSLLRANQDSHRFALAPSQAEALDKADIIVVPDLGMSPFLKRQVASKKKLLIIELSQLKGAEPLPYATENPWLSAVKEAESKTEKKADKHEEKKKEAAAALNDPHLWLDPERMASIAEPLAEAIATRVPEAGTTLKTNARDLAMHLREEVIPPLKNMLQPRDRNLFERSKPEIAFITYHSAYQYFLERFGLTRHGEIMTRPEDYVGAKTMSNILTSAQSMRIRCIISEQDGPLVRKISQHTGAKIILLSPEQNVVRQDVDALDWIKNDYDRLLYVTAKSFANCL